MPVNLPEVRHAARVGEAADGDLKAMLSPLDAKLTEGWEVSPRVNSPRNDEPQPVERYSGVQAPARPGRPGLGLNASNGVRRAISDHGPFRAAQRCFRVRRGSRPPKSLKPFAEPDAHNRRGGVFRSIYEPDDSGYHNLESPLTMPSAALTRTALEAKSPCPRRVRLLAFEVTPDPAGGFSARGAGVALCVRAETIERVRARLREAVARHYLDQPGDYTVGTTFRLFKGRTERAIDHLRIGY